VIQDVSPFTAGVMTAGDKSKLDNCIAVGLNTVLYVSPSGNDNNNGNQAHPFKTARKALSQWPFLFTGKCEIHFAPGTYIEPNLIEINVPLPSGSGANIPGLPTLIGAMTSLVGNKAATAADPGGYVFTSTAITAAVDQYFGQTLYCVSGANAGQSRLIAGNTAHAFQVTEGFETGIAIGDVFQIQSSAVTLKFDGGLNVYGPSPFLGLQQVKLQSATGSIFCGFSCRLVGESVEVDMQGATEMDFQDVSGFTTGADGAAVSSTSPFSFLRLADWYFHDGFISLNSECLSPAANSNCMKNMSVQLIRSTYAPFTFFGKNVDITASTRSSFQTTGDPANLSKIDGDNGAGYILGADKVSRIGSGGANVRNIILNDSSGDAINLQDQSGAVLQNVQGSGNAGFGISCTNMAQGRIPNSDVTVFGGAGQLLIGGSVKTYADVPYTDGDTLCRVQN
jgi:hypothetical protein